jgi:hypothetical protein
MIGKQSIACLFLALALIVPASVSPQQANQKSTLVVNGQSGNVPVIQVNGRSYVDLEALARAVNGSLSFSGNQIALSLPSGPSGSNPTAASTPAPATTQAPAPGFSQAFLKAGIEQMSTVREWHTALQSAIQNGYPVAADWLAPYRAQAAMNLRLVSVAVSSDSDRSAFQLLNNEFQNMAKLSDKYVAARANMKYISPAALANDDLNQRIITCGHSLGAMAASGQFVDDGSCD